MASTHHQNQEQDQTALKQYQHPAIVVVVPFPAQGHLSPTLQFSCKILSYNIPVHYVSSTIHNRQAKVRTQAQSSNQLDISKIQFHDFPIPPFSSPSPDPNAPTKFPSQLIPAFEACLHLRQPVAALLRALSPTTMRVVVVHDPLLSFVVQDVASIPNAESYAFHSYSAFFACLFLTLATGKPFPTEADEPNILLPSLEGFFSSEYEDFMAKQEPYFGKIKNGDLHNSSRLIEGAYLDSRAEEEAINGNKQWVIGPLIPVTTTSKKSTAKGNFFAWLNKQEKRSVIYISFGTTTSMADDQIKELAMGLEDSKVKFLWVLRDADRADIFTKETRNAQLPKGFEERTEGVGMVIRDWVPQLEILEHESIGGFMTHCGWNSCLESMTMGVPIAAWPMHSDQPGNPILLTKLLKVGLVVHEWAKRKELATRATIKEAVKRLMASEEGDEMRKRAEKLGCDVRQSVVDGGVSHKELQSFIAHITR